MRERIREMVSGYFERDSIFSFLEFVMDELKEEGFEFEFDNVSYDENDIDKIVDDITDSIYQNLTQIG